MSVCPFVHNSLVQISVFHLFYSCRCFISVQHCFRYCYTYNLTTFLHHLNGNLQGLSVTQCSWVYGCAFVTTIVFFPLFGKYIESIGSRKLFLYGTSLAGTTNILFGFLQWIDDPKVFLVLSQIVRIISVGFYTFLSKSRSLIVELG